MKKYYFIFIILFSTTKLLAQNDCIDAIVVCGNTGFTGLSATGVGTQELSGLVTCGSQENNSIWLKLSIKTTGTLAFTLKPESNAISEDFDFFIFGPNVSCGSLGQNIRCSTTNPEAINQSNNWTGLNDIETDVNEGPGSNGNSFLKSLFVMAGESYFLVVDRPIGFSNFSIEWTGTATFNDAPTFQIPTGSTIDVSQCDNDGVKDNRTAFDLSVNTPIIIGSQTNVAVTYHTVLNDAITGENTIANPTAFINTSNPQTVFARITNNTTGCFDYTTFALSVIPAVAVNISTYAVCDDATDGNDANGSATFDFDAVTAALFPGEDITTFTYGYFLNVSDANNQLNKLPRFYTSTSRTIFIRVAGANGCVTVKSIDLVVEPLPIRSTASLIQCDTYINPDGVTLFNLNQANSDFVQGNPNLLVTYYETMQDAQWNQNALVTYTNSSNPQNIIAKITNTITGCSSLSTLFLSVNVTPSLNKTINRCDVQENGLTSFNLTESNFAIAPDDRLDFYITIDDALLEQNRILNITNYTNITPYNQTIYARVENNNSCLALHTVNLIVDKLPDIQGNTNGFVCNNLPDKYITIDAGVSAGLIEQYNYIWYRNGNPIPYSTYSIQVNQAGIYTVDVGNRYGCTKTRTIEVIASSNATIAAINVQDITTDNNIVTVNLSPNSVGVYEYSLGNPSGPFQSSNIFENVPAGIHEVYINDTQGCGMVSQKLAVLDAPKFFTPNGDGINDYWKINGSTNTFFTNSKVNIFDRYGKLIYQIKSGAENGWDGTYNSVPLPADDYWYTLYLEDGRTAKGHFALKR